LRLSATGGIVRLWRLIHPTTVRFRFSTNQRQPNINAASTRLYLRISSFYAQMRKVGGFWGHLKEATTQLLKADAQWAKAGQ
jgi:hypothetical protein